MSPLATKIVPCIWFDDQAEEAVARYIKLLPKGAFSPLRATLCRSTIQCTSPAEAYR